MKYFLFFIVSFGLPHIAWIPDKLHLQPDQIPFGVMNLFFLVSLWLWFTAKNNSTKTPSPYISFNWFLALNIIGVGVAVITGYEPFGQTFSIAKNQICLLLLYFIPLATIRTKKDFTVMFMILLFVHLIVSIEVLRSGVLAGSNFNDNKRGSGPFSVSFYGSDVAGSYLAQFILYYFAFVLNWESSKKHIMIMMFTSIVLVLSIYATYARGALVAIMVGLIFMLGVIGFTPKNIIFVVLGVLLAVYIAPTSIDSRFDNTRAEGGEYDDSTQGRFFYWEAALKIIKENPLGVGTGQVRGAMQVAIGRYVDPHNGFLYTAIEYGVLGLLVFLLFLKNLFTDCRMIYHCKEIPLIYRIYALGTGGLIGALIGCNIFYANFYKDLVLGSIMLHFGMLAYIKSNIDTLQEAPNLQLEA
ncbi:MAG: O-antigen ligase family protein [Desulfuromonadales bacterium]